MLATSGRQEAQQPIEITFAGLPPSVNHYWKSRACKGFVQHYISPEGRAFKDEFMQLIPLGVQLLGPVKVSITLSMPDKRRRDVDNYLKAVLDALQPRAMKDDAQIVALDISKTYAPGQPKTYVVVEEADESWEQ